MSGMLAFLSYLILDAYANLFTKKNKSKLPDWYGRPRIQSTCTPSEDVTFIEFQKNILNQNKNGK